MFSKQFFAFSTLLLPVLAAPSPVLTVSKAGNPVSDRYIVTLNGGVSLAAHINSIQSSVVSTKSRITHEFNLINGYAGEFSVDDLNKLRANPDIAWIEEDGVSRTSFDETQSVHPPHLPEQIDLTLTDF